MATGLMLLSLQSCLSRLARPEITGIIVDYDGKPVINCKVGETVTAKDGSFTLPERRYNKFLLSEMLIMEAPPLMVLEPIAKDGFEKDAISIFHRWGGGQAKGAKYKIDTIFLKKDKQQFDVAAMLKNSSWKLSFTKYADTIYLVKNGFKQWCKTERCSPFYNQYEALTDNYYHSQVKNLPEGIIKRFIDVRFGVDNSVFNMQVIEQYKSSYNGPNKEPDTLHTKGTWKLTNKVMQLDIDKMKSISGKFKLSEIDLYQLKLTKLK